MVGRFVIGLFQALVLVLHLPHLVEREIAADGQTEGVDGFDRIPLVSSVPDFYQCFLYDILSLSWVEGDAECKPV